MIKLTRSKAIQPSSAGDWPGERNRSLYWVAGKSFVLPAEAKKAEFLLAVDRHYELFLNGKLIARHRNFNNGDKYVYAQEWGTKIRPFLKAGENTIEVVIRSDPWQNKNYRRYRPMLSLHAEFDCGGDRVELLSDGSWKAAVIEDWRKQISLCGCETIISEKIKLPTSDNVVLSGFPGKINWDNAEEFEIGEAGPDVLLSNDPPKRIDIYRPTRIVSSGSCYLPTEALSFGLGDPSRNLQRGREVVFEREFENAGATGFSLAGSALLNYRVELNGYQIHEQNDLPDSQQMELPDYIIPIVKTTTQAGRNLLRITVTACPIWGAVSEFRLASDLKQLISTTGWIDGDRKPITPKIRPLEISERIGAKLLERESYGVSITKSLKKIHIKPSPNSNLVPSVIVDMGGVRQGRVSLKIESQSSGRIYLAYGFTCKNNVVDCHRMTLRAIDILEVPAGKSSYIAFDTKAFRYLDLVFEAFDSELEIFDICVEEPVFVDETRSDFECSDSKLNEIWKASRRTAQLCTDELYVDNPEREHAQWADPVAACTQAGYYCFGEYNKAAKALEEIARAQQPDGQIPGYVPGRWFPRKPIQDHMALFALSFFEYYMQTGDEVFGLRMLAVILQMIEHWEKYRDDCGLLSELHTVFVDWGYCLYSYRKGGEGSVGSLTAMNGYYLGVLRNTARMAGFLGHIDKVEKLVKIADEVENAMRALLYDSRLGLFRDGYNNPQAEATVSQPANCLAVLYGAAPKGQERKILERIFNPVKGVEFIYSNALFAPRALESLFESHCDELAVRWLRERFGAMIDFGSDTLWETWSPCASHCQGTGAGPAYLFSRYLAGLYPAEPGYKVIGIAPHPGGLGSLSSKLTTPFGDVRIGWHREGDSMNYQITLPECLKNRPIRKPDWVHVSVDS